MILVVIFDFYKKKKFYFNYIIYFEIFCIIFIIYRWYLCDNGGFCFDFQFGHTLGCGNNGGTYLKTKNKI